MAKCSMMIMTFISNFIGILTKILGIFVIFSIIKLLNSISPKENGCPYKLEDNLECKCGSINGQTITIDSGEKYCYSSDCADTINTCDVNSGDKLIYVSGDCPTCREKCETVFITKDCICGDDSIEMKIDVVDYCFSSDCDKTIENCDVDNGDKLTYKSGDKCPTCLKKCETVSKNNDCICDDESIEGTIGETDYCFPSKCKNIIENCDVNSGDKLTYKSGDCPTCLKKCETGLINNDCICDGKREEKEIGKQNYCLGSDCKNPEECNGEIFYDENTQCLRCPDGEDKSTIGSAENVGIIVAVFAIIILLMTAIVLFALYNRKNNDIVALAQPEDHQDNPDFLVNNDDYNIVPISAERE